MDSSKILEDAEECCSNESAWTTYIASPDRELDCDDYEDDDGVCSIGEESSEKDAKKDAEDADSDDSMASDASSGPSCLRHFCEQAGGIHREPTQIENKGKKRHHQQGEKKLDEQIKGVRDKHGSKKNGAGKSKNKQ